MVRYNSRSAEGRNLHYQEHAIDSLYLTYEGSQLGSQPQLTAQLQIRHARVGTLPVEQVTLDVTSKGAEGQVQFVTERHRWPRHLPDAACRHACRTAF